MPYNAKIKKVKIGSIELHTEYFGNTANQACLLIAGAMAPCYFWTDTFCNILVQNGLDNAKPDPFLPFFYILVAVPKKYLGSKFIGEICICTSILIQDARRSEVLTEEKVKRWIVFNWINKDIAYKPVRLYCFTNLNETRTYLHS